MPSTYNDIYLEVRRQLRREGISSPELEARELVCHAAAKERSEFRRDMSVYIAPEKAEAVYRLLERRLRGEPLAYIIGEWEFMGHGLDITEDVLIPRADTEILCERAIDFLKTRQGDSRRVLDLCCGSGCIGISIALADPDCGVILGDISPAAIQVARRNIRRHSLSPRVACVQADALKPASITLGNFDMIVTNPPYIPSAEIEGLDSSVKDFEPHLALDGGKDGYDFYRAIAAGYKLILKRGGALLCEVGIEQARTVERIFIENGWRNIVIHRDLAGVQRVIQCGLLQ